MSSDGGLRPEFRKRLRQGFHWQSVETGGTGLGTPDSNFCSAGVERWIEYKQTDGWACTLRPEQVSWHLLRQMSGGVTFVATRRWHDGGPRRGEAVDELWVHRGTWVRELKTEGLRGAEPLGVWRGGPSAWNWDEVREVLTRAYPLAGVLEA